MAEDFGLCSYEKHHKHKIIFFLSSMRSFRDELRSKGFQVLYKKIDEDDFKDDYTNKLKKEMEHRGVDEISFSKLRIRFLKTKSINFAKILKLIV